MTIKSILECERKSLDKMRKNQLPHRYKKYGIGVAVICFLFLFINKFTFDSTLYREISKYGLLLSMLIISISKDQLEDEWVTSLRSQSYSFAFVMGVVLSLVQPFISFGIDLIFESENAIFKETGDFEILWILLAVQIFYFEFLKKIYG